VDAARKPVKRRLREYLEAAHPAAIDEEVWKGLLARLAPVSESYLRDLLRATGLPFEQPWAGVNQHSFEDLDRSLRELGRVYGQTAAAGDRQRARYIRRLVIGARERARFAARNPRTVPEKKNRKEEMAAWMLVWLENPEVFPAWADARRRVLNETESAGENRGPVIS
jgi:hypothetical protein